MADPFVRELSRWNASRPVWIAFKLAKVIFNPKPSTPVKYWASIEKELWRVFAKNSKQSGAKKCMAAIADDRWCPIVQLSGTITFFCRIRSSTYSIQ
jgi:hypothetical protein